MKRVFASSKQKDIKFSWCAMPVTVDLSSLWGEGNLQSFPSGVFLKHDAEGTITHGVQPKEDNSAPVGWIRQEDGLYCKEGIWVLEKLEVGHTVNIDTLDGEMNCVITKPSYLVANGTPEEPNQRDTWSQFTTDLVKNYNFTP
jgi:hypothetical protein